MKKMILILILFISFGQVLKAQTFEEWFQQKKTQKEYLVQQIAALRVYIGYAQKGYRIAKEGLNTIGGFARGEFNLHTDYFNSLKTVNPEIKRYSKVAKIIAMQVKIIQNFNKANRQLHNSNVISKDELQYIEKVFTNLLDDCDKVLDELIAVTTDGKLEMKDNERMERINKLYVDMQDKFTFSGSFSNEAITLAASRLKERVDLKTIRALQGIKN